MGYISMLGRYFHASRREWVFLLLGAIIGWCVPPACNTTIALLTTLPNKVLGILCFLLMTLFLLSAICLISLYDKLRYRTRRLKEFNPNVNINEEQEFGEAFDEATREDER